jgi:hypothetical protein
MPTATQPIHTDGGAVIISPARPHDRQHAPRANRRSRILRLTICCLLLPQFFALHMACAQTIDDLARISTVDRPHGDWLLAADSWVAGVFRTERDDELAIDNGLIRRTFRLSPNAATIAFDNIMTQESLIRGVKPEAVITVNGRRYEIGGLSGQPNYAYLRPEWLDQMTAPPNALRFVSFRIGPPQERFQWKRKRHHAPGVAWPPRGVHLRMDFALQQIANDRQPLEGEPGQVPELLVSVNYELYDGVPALCKWLTIRNQSAHTITVDRFTSEILAVVEHASWVESREPVTLPRPRSLHVETDFAFGGFNHENANRHVVHWRSDPDFTTQVNYRKETPCLLVVEPTNGPAVDIAPGDSFETCRTFELVYDSTDRERRGLALRRYYRTIAPWVTENPLMHHLLNSNPAEVKAAIDQAAEVGFEMIILSFGSGFNMDNQDPAYLATWKHVADYAQEKGIEIGSYSLLSSRRVADEHMIVSPEGQQPTHGQCPALTSEWGQNYLQRLKSFYQSTGFDLLEHDGSYPGDVDVTPRPPLQKGEQDSRWVQWRLITEYYKWCRERGIYLNVPDYYFLSGSNKTGMGYREVNWSLPREMQTIHTRQNIYDGSWTKTPSMGWMFVPLSQYHGGGAAATIEPLAQHLDHYRRMLDCNLGFGVQACYRGPRLFDSPATKAMVKERVDWFLQYRDILESDLIHGRRADGRDIDWMLHVNPQLPQRGMLVAFNPLHEPITRQLTVNLYYTGLTDVATLQDSSGKRWQETLARDYTIPVAISIEPQGMAWLAIE